ncbi:hypothetical protein ASE90_17770 [Sphingomonas sp. Leaf67]|nr:hypothetical protein ASE90_17770 [Sphingomonas sp. Leaf67]
MTIGERGHAGKIAFGAPRFAATTIAQHPRQSIRPAFRCPTGRHHCGRREALLVADDRRNADRG